MSIALCLLNDANGGAVANSADGLISGSLNGVAVQGANATVMNAGTITGPSGNNIAGTTTIPAGLILSGSVKGDTAVRFALAQLGKPYVFGAAGPTAYDCSGLTMAAWAQAGVELPHSSQEQALVGTPTTPAALVPGDLVLVPGDDGTLAAPGHVGIYIGDGMVLNAADQQDGIRVQTYANFIEVGHGLSALRHIE